MKKKIILAIAFIVVIAGSIFIVSQKNEKKKIEKIEKVEFEAKTNFNIVTSLEDKIGVNSAWCGTFNLIWNDLKNDLAKQDIVFTPQPEVVENLNKGTFHTGYLSENSYYKVYGNPSLALKAEIEKAIEEKFHEKSDILDDFDWNGGNPGDYFLYAMLKKEFEFPVVFTELENGKFGNYEDVKYFGIDESSESEMRNQVEVLYYTSKEDFAIKLLTKTNDEVILSRGNKEETFGDIYQGIMQKKDAYEGEYEFGEEDILQIPNIKFDLKEEIREVENRPFYFSNGDEYTIEKALQTIQFELDKKGGKIKSEAGMMIRETAILLPSEPREFLVDDTFTLFLVEQGKDLPYFATKISDIGKVQEEAKKLDDLSISEETAENFALQFVDQSYESKSKVRPILEKTENEKYDYNIYAYLGEVNLLIDGENMPLREALLENKITMDEIIAKANQDLEEGKIKGDMYKDGRKYDLSI